MRMLSFVGTAVLLMAVGQSASLVAQEPKEEAKPQAQEPARPAQAGHPEDMKPAVQEPEKHGQDDKNMKQDDKAMQEERKDDSKKAEEDRKADEKNAKQDDRKDHERATASAAKGKRIPDDKFKSSFGRQHTFAIRQPVIVENRPRFQYSGYWFEIVDAWPTGWAYTDDCYIDYVDDGYYLFDPLHPGIRIAIMVVG